MKKSSILILFFLCLSSVSYASLRLGADRLEVLLPLIKEKKVALVVNQTSCLSNGTHLLDTLLAENIQVKKIFAPEHGIRGNADAGETVIDGKDPKTGINITSLYGKNKKPTRAMLNNIDIVIFDIQDVGARFYTYISTMHYVMEACAEQQKTCIILDRPNPHDFIDGPILESSLKSFVGMHPIPVLHGLTIGELAKMINGEGWLNQKIKCKLKIITLEGWKHGQAYSLPIKPSPNLPNDQSIKLYASLCFFEATNVSVGRGTYFPFQAIGYPDPKFGDFTFTPKSLPGFDKNPLQKDKLCYGVDLRQFKFNDGLSLKFLISFYKKSGSAPSFFKSPRFMDNLAGTSKLRLQIQKGATEEEIRKSWENDLTKYKTIRKKYLLYTENDKF
ncbi:DUF1343 domain-containing protein [Dysgonomonas sp. 216]|uniref:exo-beta-N-acetylmuramidase NamZ family protein n=1 Tax=Dysgonomonas sp. 216 TaxID=2302934 RepID=UPI0013D4DB1E|nr:DUF1343 domain-containing protein [Dysgonomonas sp. 216]NDW17511.1 DUF1343 domain-containing protein [Dysgonomonas sp. 216]